MSTKLLALCLVMCAGCAVLKPGVNGTTEVIYNGTAGGATLILAEQNLGAARLLAEQNRATQTAQAGRVAEKAIDKGMPATLNQDVNQSNVQAGYAYPWMTSMYGGAFMGGSPVAMYGDAATAGYVPGRLPQVGYPQVGYIQPQSQIVVQAQAGNGNASGGNGDQIVACPKGRKAQTTAELTACNTVQIKNLSDAVTK